VVVLILLTPLLSRWPDTGLTLSVLTPVSSRSLILVLAFDCAGGRLGELLVDGFWLFETYDR